MSSTIKYAPKAQEQRSTVPSSGNVTKDVVEGLAKGAVSGIVEPIKEAVIAHEEYDAATIIELCNSVIGKRNADSEKDSTDFQRLHKLLLKSKLSEGMNSADKLKAYQQETDLESQKNIQDFILQAGKILFAGGLGLLYVSREHPKRVGPFGLWYV